MPIVLQSNQNNATVGETEVCTTLPAAMGMGGGCVPMIVESDMCVTQAWDGTDVSPTLTKHNAGGEQRMPDKGNFTAVVQVKTNQSGADEKTAYVPDVAHALHGKANCMFREDAETYIADKETTTSVVRRLTPKECERLQGYPDFYTLIGDPEEVEVKDYEPIYDEEGNETGRRLVGTHKEIEYFYTDRFGKRKKCADSARYKALGNSIALPFWFWLLRRISAQYERPATLGSLFDGIGGFPLCWERCNGAGTALWASEIEDFPIEVTRRRFPEVDDDESLQ